MEMNAVACESTLEVRNGERSIFRNCQRPVILKFEDVVFKVRTKEKNTGGGSGEKTILSGVSGTVLPGEMLAVLGPSGSGKTTLITALAGRRHASLSSGTITFNGSPFSSSMKHNTGFVTQHDVLYPNLTVSETLIFTALLRLPGGRSLAVKKDKVALAEAVVSELGLSRCRDIPVGGVSGGERKRVSIGQELLLDPGLLLLDEPTSGLDSTTAQRIVSIVAGLAAGGRTVAMTIHQPSSRLFYMFRKVILLSDGWPVYYGRREDAMGYFNGIGFSPDIAMNPADFLLDLANGIFYDGEVPPAGREEAEVKRELVAAYEANQQWRLKEEMGGEAPAAGRRRRNIATEKEEPSDDEELDRRQRHRRRWSTTWWEQFRILAARDIKERKHEAFSALNVIQILAVAFVSGSLWWRSSGNLQAQTGLLFFVTAFWGAFPLFGAIFTFPMERQMLTKERTSGMYRLSSYYFARMANDLPMQLILPVVFSVAVYWSAGLNPSPARFSAFLASILLGVLVSQGLGLMIGALIMDLKSAMTVASVSMLGMMLAGGFYVQRVQPFVEWIKYVSYNYYTYRLLLDSQFAADETYPCVDDGATTTEVCWVADFLAVRAIGLGRPGEAVGAMIAMLVFYRLVAYAALTRIGRPRRGR